MKELSLHILDIVQNSLKANATKVTVTINENEKDNTFNITVEDNGCGMSKEIIDKVTNPFYTTRTTRKVGLGIPLLQEAANRCNGWLKINSSEGKGTRLECMFERNNIDRAPLGNIADTIMTIVNSLNGCEFEYKYFFNNQLFSFSTEEIKKIVGESAIRTPEVLLWIKEYVAEGMQNVSETSKN